jgi:endo-1,4-beta-xylanase
MRRSVIRYVTIGAAALAVVPAAALQDVALKDLMPKGMVIGVAINQRQFDGADAAAVDLITRQFNQISPENVLKFQPTQPAADRYAFDAADRYVQFGLDRHMQLVGHNLVWHSQTGAWVFQGADGKPADRDTLLARMRDHIRTVVGRYKGKIHGWDVVNEAIDEDGSMRKSPWQVGIGDDYVAKAFEFAHDADPDAELYYNDFNLEQPAKRAGVIKLVRDLQTRKLRIDGIGNQAHWRLGSPSIDEIDQALVELSGTGLKVMYSELDINLLPDTARGADPATANPYANGLPDQIQQQLARRYADVFGVFLKHRDAVTRVTFWGLSDADSWLNRGRMNYPLLWDRQRQPKPAFTAVVEALRQSPTSPRLAGEAPAPAAALSLWYRTPASDHPLLPAGASRDSRQAATAEWVRALPVGNGRLGAMVFGGVVHERLQLNEDTLWAGRPYDPVNPQAKGALPDVRRLLAERPTDGRRSAN